MPVIPVKHAANLVTGIRILLIPLFVTLLVKYSDSGDWAFRWSALALFALIALSDWLDGLVARKFNCNTPLGEFLDPAADKFLMLGTLGYLSFFDVPDDLHIPEWFAWTYIGRDLFMLFLYLLIGTVVKNVKVAPVFLGKLGTCTFFVLVLSVVAGLPTSVISIILCVNTFLILVTIPTYIKNGYRQWKPLHPDS